jgi:hypothetical protein
VAVAVEELVLLLVVVGLDIVLAARETHRQAAVAAVDTVVTEMVVVAEI